MPKHDTVDSFLNDQSLPSWMRIQMERLRQLLSTFPEITEKIRYTVPFYDYCGMLLYIAPYQKKRLVIGFCNGVHMKVKSGVLINDTGQTQIRHYELSENKNINEKVIIRLIYEAMKVNKQLYDNKHSSRATK